MASLQNAGICYTDCLSMFLIFFSVFTLLLITWEVHSSLRRIFPNVRVIAFTLLIGFGYSQKTKLWCFHWLNSYIMIMLQKWSVWKSLMQELSWHTCHLITMHLQARRRYIFYKFHFSAVILLSYFRWYFKLNVLIWEIAVLLWVHH